MARFILRFTGRGSASESDLARIQAAPNVTVLDRSPRMLLVEAPDETVKHLAETLPDWSYSPERRIALPDPTPKIRSS
jgi:hypothetical protein